MTQADLIEEVSRALELPLKEGKLILDTILDGIAHSLRQGDKVEMRGFGTFHTRPRKARIGRNPKTGASVSVPAKRVPFFKPSKDLRQLVNGSESREPIAKIATALSNHLGE